MTNYLLLVNIALLAAAIALLWSNRQRASSRDDALKPLLSLAPPSATEVRELLGRPRPRLISIEILNPIQLAAQHNAFAGLLGNLAPGLIRREVHRQAAGILRAELEKWQVLAEVRVHEPD